MSKYGPKIHLYGLHPRYPYAPGFTRCGVYAANLTLLEREVTCQGCLERIEAQKANQAPDE